MAGFGNNPPLSSGSTNFGGFGLTPGTTTNVPQLQPNNPTGTYQFSPNTNATSGFSFGNPTSQAQAQVSSNTMSPLQRTSNFNFNTNQPLSSTPNQPSIASTAPPFTGFGLTKPTTTTSSFAFNTPVATTTTAPTAFAFPNTTQTTSAPAFTFNTATTSSTIATSASLNFGTTTTTATPGTTLGSAGVFGAKPTSSAFTLPTSSAGAFGSATVTAPQQQSLQPTNLCATSVAPAKSLGLGGLDVNSSQPKNSEGRQDVRTKDIIIPQPIRETIDNLRNFIKQQKSISSDIARSTFRKLHNVTTDIKNIQWSLQDISVSVEKDYTLIKNLRLDTSRAIQSVEMAQRTHDTPVGLQFENIIPIQYFQDLVRRYENDLLTFRQQVELTEKHMRSLTCPETFSPVDLKRGLQQIHESFIALAGRLHDIHQKVEVQKSQYLSLRKYYFRDATNVFAELENDSTDLGLSNISSGPTPFSNLTGTFNSTFQQVEQTQGNIGFGSLGNVNTNFNAVNKPMFGNVNSSFGSTPVFNLQNPPAGAKRNKQ